MAAERIRESVIAGSWYPDHPTTLKEHIGKYLDQAKVSPLGGELVALIVPHAGYIYSGGVAAHAYALLRHQPFDRVLILAPSHRAAFRGASVYNLGGYRTPLGVVPLDQEVVDDLRRHPSVTDYLPQAHDQEHSLEIQIPFLQVVLDHFLLTPIVMGDQSLENCTQLAEAIAAACRDRRVLLVASTDLSHFHPYQEAKELDQIVLDRVAALDAEGLSRAIRTGECEACGGGPMVTIMLAAQKMGATKSTVLRYANSGDITGDMRGVVGYMAAALYDNPGGKRSHGDRENVGVDLGLSDEEKATLHRIAEQAIRSQCLREPMPEAPVNSSKLQEPRGAFVSLHKGGELRGCIGTIEGRAPLHETIKRMAIQAAFADPRFCALEPDELSKLAIEISVLTPLERITDPSRIEIGKHGLVVRNRNGNGLLLPQVAPDQGWDRLEFLEWTCRKACLPPDAWKDANTEIYIFSADVF